MKEASGIRRTASAAANPVPPAAAPGQNPHETAFGCPRDFLSHRFVYVVISPRARGLSVGVNMNPDAACNFNCVYCEVDRRKPRAEQHLDITVMAEELTQTLFLINSRGLREHPCYRRLPDELLQLRHVTLSGDGEPTLAPNFTAAVQEVLHVRALSGMPFFKLVLVTNATGLNRPDVRKGLKLLTQTDEVWAKLDGGTQEYLNRVSGAEVPLNTVLENILKLGRKRPVVIQSLFPALNDQEPPLSEITEYAMRLKELKESGAQISLVQIYSATRPTHNPACGHLPLRALSSIAQIVRRATGLKVEVY
jgi:wyosine [tRNA(Phe)-imidazoG37] synthetase (radical SAM superfamily)